VTRGIIAGQIKALAMIVAIEGLNPAGTFLTTNWVRFRSRQRSDAWGRVARVYEVGLTLACGAALPSSSFAVSWRPELYGRKPSKSSVRTPYFCIGDIASSLVLGDELSARHFQKEIYKGARTPLPRLEN
jgi:hypothetical protein